jgi:hypothetical protein
LPKLTCLCGETINLSPIPNPQGLMIIWERIVEPLIDALVKMHRETPSEAEFERQAYRLIVNWPNRLQAYECPKCGRLAIFVHASDANPALWFERERVDQFEANSIHSLAQRALEESEQKQ